jgi:hypothetical protein
MTASIPYVAGDATYRYPAAGDEPAPPGAKCLILTEGGVCVIGTWGDDAIAWAPLPRRNSTKEGLIRVDHTTTAAAAPAAR